MFVCLLVKCCCRITIRRLELLVPNGRKLAIFGKAGFARGGAIVGPGGGDKLGAGWGAAGGVGRFAAGTRVARRPRFA